MILVWSASKARIEEGRGGKQKSGHGRSLDVGAAYRVVLGARKAKNGGWQRPTLPRSYPRSTIGARTLNCRVRDGAGWTRTALATNTPFRSLRSQRSALSSQLKKAESG